MNDSYDGHIDGTYPVGCYTNALRRIPSDGPVYHALRHDIHRLLAAGVSALKARGSQVSATSVLAPATLAHARAHGTLDRALYIAAIALLLALLAAWAWVRSRHALA